MRKILLVLLCLMLAAGLTAFTGCGSKDNGAGQPDENTDPVVEEQDYSVTLFFANEDYITSGDESLEKFMVYQTDMKAIPADAYKAALELLKTSPDQGYSTVITDQITFNDVYTEGDTAYVDLSSSGLNGGSLEETFLISQIVDTLLNTFPEIKQVQFLVDGQPTESLMGHFDASAPFSKDLFAQ